MSGPTHVCREPGCGKSTSEQKPYCFDHLARMPAVAAILRADLAREARKAAKVAARVESAQRPCVGCGGRMPAPKSTGRLRTYCSDACMKRTMQRNRRARIAGGAPPATPVVPTGDHSALDAAAIRVALDHLNTGLRLLADALAATKGA